MTQKDIPRQGHFFCALKSSLYKAIFMIYKQREYHKFIYIYKPDSMNDFDLVFQI